MLMLFQIRRKKPNALSILIERSPKISLIIALHRIVLKNLGTKVTSRLKLMLT